MADYISREKVLEKAQNERIRLGYDVVSVRDIESISVADVAEVVRCKDCKYHRKNDENEPYCVAEDGLSAPWDDEFCSHAVMES